MQSIRTRLTLNYLIVLILGMTLAGVFTWLAVERLYVNTQRENLLAQARLMATAVQGSALPIGPAEPYSQLSNVAPGIHTRLLSETGAVVVGVPFANDFTVVPAAENYASIPTVELVRRPEIDSALNGTPATAIRRVLGDQRVLYAAAPIYAQNGAVSGIVYIATPLPAAGLPTNIILQLLGAILLAVLLATFFGGLLAQKIVHPLEGLTQAATAIANGDLKKRVESNGSILELHYLSDTFNDMADRLHQSDEAKKAFVADVTHELRTPLTVIKGTIETLEDGALDDIEGRGALLTSMQRETERLIRLVNELLVLTRADAGVLQLDKRPLDLVELVKARCEAFNRIAAQKEIILDCRADCPEGVLRVQADSDRVAQVIDNLLDNAMRHSLDHSTISIRVEEKDDGMECSVIDQGTGIAAEHLPFIFERFYRADASRSRNRLGGGTGLGLAIAKALVQAHGGRIQAQSTEGHGTTISFWLPMD